MINAAVILNAEKDLYNSVLNRDFSRDIKTDIQKIVENEYQSAKNKTPLSLYSNYLILFEKTAGPFFFRKTIQFGKAD